MMMGDGWGGWIWGALMMLLFWGGLIALAVFLVRGSGSRPSQGEQRRREPEARDILAERFARGEISEDEFEERRRVLDRSFS
ncbi:MAG TPA: SHOCT domain-containing protein [Actinomycetota bacterium]